MSPEPRPAPVPVPVLELQDIDIPSPADPEAILLRDVNWRVAEGECWLLSGPPGAGKSSVLQVAAGLVRPARGCHRLFGAELTALGESDQVVRRSRIGVVFGGGGRLFTHLNVLENLALPLQYHAPRPDAVRWDRLEAVVEGLGLGGYVRRTPRELPRRMAARVALARALVLTPEVLLLDDPAAGLPAEDTEWWRTFLVGCTTGRGVVETAPRTVVIAAQDASRWRDLAQRRATVDEAGWTVDGRAAPANPGTDAGAGAGLRPTAGQG